MEWVELGRIGAPYGVKGWMHIDSFTDPPTGFSTTRCGVCGSAAASASAATGARAGRTGRAWSRGSKGWRTAIGRRR